MKIIRLPPREPRAMPQRAGSAVIVQAALPQRTLPHAQELLDILKRYGLDESVAKARVITATPAERRHACLLLKNYLFLAQASLEFDAPIEDAASLYMRKVALDAAHGSRVPSSFLSRVGIAARFLRPA